MEEDAEGGLDRKESKRVDTAGDRGNERRLVIVTASHKTEDDVFRARDEGGRSGEGDDVGVQRGAEEDSTTEEKVDGGDTGGKGMGLEDLREVVRNRSVWRMLTITVTIGFIESTAQGRGVQYVHWVMHKCIMVKVGGKRNTRKVCKKQVNLCKTEGEVCQSMGEIII